MEAPKTNFQDPNNNQIQIFKIADTIFWILVIGICLVLVSCLPAAGRVIGIFREGLF